MKPVRVLHVQAALPQPLQPLRELAYNLYWAWHPEVIALFRRIDADLWEASGHNPVRMIGELRQPVLDTLADNEGFLAHLRRASEAMADYLTERGYVSRGCEQAGLRVAYFSMEFGLTECLEIYSGGLGMLAGDHLKSASDIGVPLVALGLLYQQGYFRQYLNAEGWQQEVYPVNDFYRLPVQEVRLADGNPLQVAVPMPTGPVWAKVWLCRVGRVPLYLLDTNLPDNVRPEDRDITDRLYGGDDETRIRQELVLGIGGLRALDALDLRPTVCHMNEGHAAFLGLERIRVAMEEHGLTFEEARKTVAAGTVFTTHTPVPAGNERFPNALVEHYLAPIYTPLGLTGAQFIALGREDPSDAQEQFCTTVLAFRMSESRNGVSELHGEVARNMWTRIWPDVPTAEIPIGHITNGVHARSWVSGDMAELFDRYLGTRWADDPMDRAVWERVESIPDEELWRVHDLRRERLVAFARRRLRLQLERSGASPRELQTAGNVLAPKALTIGFARRFALYKRAGLLLRNLDRLDAVLNHPERPVQILYAGKAHPRDQAAKELLRDLVQIAQRPEFRQRIVFLEDYDQHVARWLVQGCDLWLNNPLRPMEASGTSGMKVVFNAGLNASIPDGWWAEGYNGVNGWSIGQGEAYDDPVYQDDVESSALYDLLERDIVPTFYNRGTDGVPHDWVARIKNSLRTLAPVFNTNRMVLEYTRKFYLPAGARYTEFIAGDPPPAVALAQYEQRVRRHWPEVAIMDVGQEEPNDQSCLVGQRRSVTATVALGALQPEEVRVQAYYGALDSHDEIINGQTAVLSLAGPAEVAGRYVFRGEVPCRSAGRLGYSIRVVPHHPSLGNPLELGLIRWPPVG